MSEKYEEGKAWCAYKQFCQHFLAPLALMVHVDVRLSSLLKNYIDGIPLDLASRLLPFKTKLNLSIFSHIHLHAKGQKKFENRVVKKSKNNLSKFGMLTIVDSLESMISNFQWKLSHSEWSDYYNDTNYSESSLQNKVKIISELLDKTETKFLWDLGANTGFLTRIATQKGINCIAFDIDTDAIEKNYQQIKKNRETNILPLFLDLTNPSPAIGWSNDERDGLFNRRLPDTTLAMAIIHHLAISNNIPLDKIGAFFQKITKNLIIEFVPKEDSQVQRLLATREDIFPDYTIANFENEFSLYFKIVERVQVEGTCRIIYLLTSL